MVSQTASYLSGELNYKKLEILLPKKTTSYWNKWTANEEHWFNEILIRFFQLKGIVESIFKILGISYNVNSLLNKSILEDNFFFYSNKKHLAKIGAVNPTLLSEIGLKDDCFYS